MMNYKTTTRLQKFIVLNKIIVIRSLRINSISQRLTRLLQHHEFCYLSHYEYEQNKSICVYFYCYLFIIFLHTNRSHKSPRCIQEHYLKNGLCFYVYPIKSLIFFDCFVNLIRTDLAKLSSNELYLLIKKCFNTEKLIVSPQSSNISSFLLKWIIEFIKFDFLFPLILNICPLWSTYF